MKANEFIKIFGMDETKRIVDYRDKHASRTHVYKFNKSCVDKAKLGGGAYLYTESYNDWSVSVDELKNLLESHELVGRYGTADEAKEYLPMLRMDSYDELKQAILDVESCQ